MQTLRISTDGTITAIYSDDLLSFEGDVSISRASHVEPSGSNWMADLGPVNGPVLGPFRTRAEALKSEVEWLEKNILQK